MSMGDSVAFDELIILMGHTPQTHVYLGFLRLFFDAKLCREIAFHVTCVFGAKMFALIFRPEGRLYSSSSVDG